MSKPKIDIDKILRKHCYITADGQEDLHTSIDSVKDAMEDFGKQLLQKVEYEHAETPVQAKLIRNTINQVKF